MNRPKTLHIGGVLYWVLQTRNPDTMVLTDADSTPTVAVRKNGASVGDSVTVTKRAATTGLYDCSYNPASEIEGDSFTLEESATVTGTTTGSATYAASFVASVVAVERGTDGANTTAPDNANIVAGAASAASADGKLTAGRLSRIDRIPDVAAGAATGLAIVGSEMALSSAVLAALFSDTDTAALVTAIIERIEDDLDGADLSVAAIAVAVRDAILNRVLAGNHDTAGTAGRLIQNADAAVSTRASQTTVDDVPTNSELATALGTADDPVLAAIALEAVKTTAIQVVTVKLNTGLVLDGAVYQWTANALELAPAGGGGSGDASQTTLLAVQDTVEAIAAAIAGAPVNSIGRVAAGGRLVVYIGDDWRARSSTAQTIPVSDPAGGLYTKLIAIGAANLQFGASRLNSAAGLITGTVVSVTQTTIDTVLHCLISVEMTAAGVGLQPADDYEYQISQRQTHSAEFDDFVEVSGQLSLRARRVAVG